MSFDTGLHLATSLLMLVFGLGAWRAKRESNEAVTAQDVNRLSRRCDHQSKEIASKVGWKDFEREGKTIRRELELQLEPVCDRVERLERRVFHGGANG